MSYTTQAKVENMFGVTLTAAQAAAMTDFIAAIKVMIDRYCGKTFEAATETRYYDGNGRSSLLIDAFVGDPSSVQILSNTGAVEKTLTIGKANDYITGPYNAGPGGSAEKNLLILNENSSYGKFPERLQSVKVVASFGASTSVPADIQYASTKLAGLMLQENGEGILTSIRLGDYQAAYGGIEDALGQEGFGGVSDILDSHRDIDI